MTDIYVIYRSFNTSINATNTPNADSVENFDYMAEVGKFGWGVCLIGLGLWITSYIFVTCLNAAAESQVFRIRCLFLKAILRQDIGWYDTHETGNFASKMTEYVNIS